jgi:phage-related minor tail protein
MAQELAAYYISLVPSAKNLTQNIAKELKGVDAEADKAGKSSGGAFTKAFGALAAGAAIGVALTAGITKALDVDKATDKLAAGLGLNAKESEKAGAVAGKLYANAYGGSMEEVNTAVGSVISSIKGMRTASSADVEAMTAKVLDMSTAFEIDTGRAAQVAGQMITSGLAKDGVEAADLLTASLQKVPAAVREDLMDAVDEYGPFMKNLGLSGGEAMTMLVDASAKGMYGIDKTGDALKEFGIRATDMSKATDGAYQALGLDTVNMTNDLLAGGDTARGAFDTIISGLGEMKDPASQSAAAIALFGTPLEDLSVTEIPKFIDGLLNSQEALGTVDGAADAMGKTLNDNAATNIETFKRGLEMGITDMLNNNVVPAINDAAKWINTSFIPALQGAGQWIKDNAAWLVPLTAAVAAYVAVMGTMSIIAAVRGWVAAAAAAQWGLNAAMTANPIGLIVAGIAALVAGLIWFFTQTELGKDIVKNVWGFIQGAVKAVVDWFQNTAMPIIQEVFRVVGAVFTWLYENIIKPVWNGITTVIGGVWAFISGVFNLLVAIIKTHIVPVFQQIWHTVQQVFNDVKNAIMRFWYTHVKPIFDAVVGFLQRTFGPAFDYLGKLAGAVWRTLYEAIYKFWYQNVKPVFDTIGKAVKEALPKAFESGVSAVKKAWEKIQEIAKAPVRFVVNTVINDGLIAGFNSLAVPLGVKKLDPVALPAGFAEGGYTGPGGKYQPAGIVHAGEIVWSQDDIARWGGVGMVEAMRKAAGFARGGIVNPLKQMALTQGYNRVHKGVDLAAAVGTPVFATQSGRVSHAGPGASAPGVWGGQEIHIAGGGIETWFAHLSRIGVKLGDIVRAGQQIGLSGNTGISSGPHLHFGAFNGGWPNDIDPLAYLGGAGIPSGGGFNPIAGIIDGLMSKIREAGGGPFADIAIGIGKKIIDGVSKFVTDFLSGNTDKKGNATATVYDGGGWLENTGGAQLVQHNKRKPDAVLSSEQWDTMTRIADNARSGDVHIHGNVGWDPHRVAQEIEVQKRRTQTMAGMGGMVMVG